jgi:hypothetical protein
MTTNFTDDGIMVTEGVVIDDNVSVSTYYNGEQNLLSLSYIDNSGILNKTTKSLEEYTLMVDHESNTINGILPKNGEWYLFWNNKNNLSVFGI